VAAQKELDEISARAERAEDVGASAAHHARAPVVLEVGGSYTKVGFAGDVRRAVFPSVVGYFTDDEPARAAPSEEEGGVARNDGDNCGVAAIGDAALAAPWLGLGSVFTAPPLSPVHGSSGAAMVLDPVEWRRAQTAPAAAARHGAESSAARHSAGGSQSWRSRLTSHGARMLAAQGYHALSGHGGGSAGGAAAATTPDPAPMPAEQRVEEEEEEAAEEQHYSVELQRAGGIGILLGTMLDQTPFVMDFTGGRQAASLGVQLGDQIVEVAGIDVRRSGEVGVVGALQSSEAATTVVFVFVRAARRSSAAAAPGAAAAASSSGGGASQLPAEPPVPAEEAAAAGGRLVARGGGGDEDGSSWLASHLHRPVRMDWQHYEVIWRHAYYDVLAATPALQPLLLVEPTVCPPKAVRDRLLKMAFEVLHVQQLCLAPAPTLALLSASAPPGDDHDPGDARQLLEMQTGVVVRCGTHCISAVAVVGGYILPHTLCSVGLGGALLASVCMMPSLERAGWTTRLTTTGSPERRSGPAAAADTLVRVVPHLLCQRLPVPRRGLRMMAGLGPCVCLGCLLVSSGGICSHLVAADAISSNLCGGHHQCMQLKELGVVHPTPPNVLGGSLSYVLPPPPPVPHTHVQPCAWVFTEPKGV
jgi:hypothetical protein